MDEFVTEIQNNIGLATEDVKNKPNKFRELLGKILVSPSTEINIIEKCDEEGNVIFDVPMKSVGVTVDSGPAHNQANDSITSEERVAVWKMSMIAWGAHPIIGVGYGGYSKANEHIDDVVCQNFDIHQ